MNESKPVAEIVEPQSPPHVIGAFLLLVEDHKDTAELIAELFRWRVSCLRIVHSLGEARELLCKALPDLIILDRRLPDGDGLDFWNQLRLDRDTRALPVLFLTARDFRDGDLHDLRTKKDDYLIKPFSPQELLARTETMLQGLV